LRIPGLVRRRGRTQPTRPFLLRRPGRTSDGGPLALAPCLQSRTCKGDMTRPFGQFFPRRPATGAKRAASTRLLFRPCHGVRDGTGQVFGEATRPSCGSANTSELTPSADLITMLAVTFRS
jgi:hypothetical protein